MEVLRVEDLSKSFGGIQAVWDVSFTITLGEKVAIIGPNGAGKTTLLSLLNGQVFPTGGRIFLFGKEITTMPTFMRARLGMARSFQHTTLFPGLTVLTNILLALGGTRSAHLGLFQRMTSNGHLLDKAEKFLSSMSLWEMRNSPVRNLSYGEQRRLEILLCLSPEPRILLLDEPNCGLTAGESVDLIGRLDALSRDIPVVIVSHDLDLVFGVANRIIVLHYGQIVADGKPEVIKDDPRVREIYLGMTGEKPC